MMSLSQVIKGIGSTSYPIISQLLMNKYGFRGALAIIGAIHSHVILSMILMKPVKYHHKKVYVSPDEAQECKIELEDLLEKNELIKNNFKILVTKSNDIVDEIIIKFSDEEYDLKPMNIGRNDQNETNTIDPISNSKRVESMMSLNYLDGGAILCENSKSPLNKKWYGFNLMFRK